MEQSATDRWAALRRDYARGGLAENDLADDPIDMFGTWLEEAIAAEVYEPNAMVLATCDPAGGPSARMVLLKGLGPDGFRFFTNLGSRKALEIAANPRVALLFGWHAVERQIRVEGVASELSRADVAAYFRSRPRGARIGAHASPQSQPVGSRAELAERYADLEAHYAGVEEIPVPEGWGGYVVRPEAVEFWQGRPGRMHDRLVYRRTDAGWETVRLAP